MDHPRDTPSDRFIYRGRHAPPPTPDELCLDPGIPHATLIGASATNPFAPRHMPMTVEHRIPFDWRYAAVGVVLGFVCGAIGGEMVWRLHQHR